MNKKIGVVGTRGSIKKSVYKSTDELLNNVGQNTGNLLFQYAACDLIDEDIVVIGEDIPWDVNLVKQHCRLIVIPSANFIREGFDFSGFVNFLEQTDLKLMFLGLGAQAKDYSQTEFDFHPSILKLISLLKERSLSVSIRGEFTKQLLLKYGVEHTLVTGCPTNLINNTDNFIDLLEKKWNKPVFSFVATGDEPWPKDLIKRDAERKMVEWVAKGNGLFLQQSVAPFIKYARQSNKYQNDKVPEHHESSLRNSLAPWMSDEEFRSFVAVKLRLYYSVDQWMEDSARVDFSTGLRLHGNMAAWQAGTPAVWVYHDSRTRELAETMSLPRLEVSEFLKCDNIDDMKNSVEFQFEHYANKRKDLTCLFKELFDTHSVKFRK
jgi:hypothetical protein